MSRERPESKDNVLKGIVKALIFLGEMLDCQVMVGSQVIRAGLHPKSKLGTKTWFI